MTPSELAALFNENVALFRPVPPPTEDFVCVRCLGPVREGFSECYACSMLFRTAPDTLQNAVVPMTSALSPSPWYSRLWNYKRGNNDYAWVLVALVDRYLREHAGDIEKALDGAVDVVTVVPSKRGTSFTEQMLRRVVAAAPSVPSAPQEVLALTAGATIGRREYKPDAFSVQTDVNGARVLLIEDAWLSGSTALSAAGALVNGGVAKVLLVPIARVIDNPDWWGSHPYIAAMEQPYEVAAWPRRAS